MRVDVTITLEGVEDRHHRITVEAIEALRERARGLGRMFVRGPAGRPVRLTDYAELDGLADVMYAAALLLELDERDRGYR